MSYAAGAYKGKGKTRRSRVRGRPRKIHEKDARRMDVLVHQKTLNSERRTKPDEQLLVKKTKRDIVQIMHRRFDKSTIWAENAKDAIGQLFRLIKRPKRIIAQAFEHMLNMGEIFEVEDIGYMLNPTAA